MTKLDPVKSTPFMSVVEGRKPRQKVHTSLGHAKNAFDTPKKNDKVTLQRRYDSPYTHGWGAIFEHINGDWVQIYEIPQPTDTDRMEDDRGSYVHVYYETRPWRRNDGVHHAGNEGVRTATHQVAEPAGPGGHLGGVPGAGGRASGGGDDQRAAGGRDDSAGQRVREVDRGYGGAQEGADLREVVVAEMSAARSRFEYYRDRWADKGFDSDREGMLRYEGRMNGLMWVIERM